jgi:GT2 family glycosyltransferase
MTTFAVTVTYGNRFHLLKQVVDGALREGVSKVIVVDNNSVPQSREQLKAYEHELGSDKIKVLYLDDNYGSAGGFKRGLEEAYNDDECEYILVLDDDNLILEHSMKKANHLTNYLQNLDNNFILSFYRGERADNDRIVKEGWIKGYLANNFCGFNFAETVKRKLSKNKKNSLINLFPLQPIQVTAMGGSFFHKSVLEKIGYPNEDFYLYADDHDFSYRFVKSGGHIFFCSELKLKDIDSTTISDEGKNIGYFDEEFSEFKMYYQIRNHTYFAKNFIENKILFYGNMTIYISLHFKKIFKTPKKLFFRRYSLLLRAINDGLNNRLGRIF